MADDALKIRAGIAEVLQTIAGLKVYDHSPRAIDSLPAVELGLPLFRRQPLGEAESELHRYDLVVEWPLALHVALRSDLAGQTLVLGLLDQLVDAVEAYPTLSTAGVAIVTEARLVAGEGTFVVRDENEQPLDRPKIVYDLELHALRLIDY